MRIAVPTPTPARTACTRGTSVGSGRVGVVAGDVVVARAVVCVCVDGVVVVVVATVCAVVVV